VISSGVPPRLELVVPCYNEAERLDVEAIAQHASADEDVSFRFVDDGSTDATPQVLEALCAQAPERLRWMRLEANRGKAEAVRRGMRAALAADVPPDELGYWDADLATPLSEVARFREVLATHPGIHLVMGSRVQLLGRTIERRFHRHAYGRVFTTAVSGLLALPVYDTQCGAKIFRVSDALDPVFAEPFVTRWIFDVEILARLMGQWEPAGIDTATRIYELPLLVWRDVPGSKIGVADAALAMADLARIARCYRGALMARRRARHG
jgi:dolichyl-phosphate beta-glucosyltransferase